MNHPTSETRGAGNAAVEKLAAAIVDLAASGAALNGDRLVSERQLAELVHESRRQVRTALRHLERTGDVHRVPRSGTYVTDRSGMLPAPRGELGSIYHLMAARLGLEPVAAQVAAQEAKRSEILQIYSAMKKVEENLRRHVGADDADTNFHQAIIRASHNPFLIGMMSMVDHLIRTHYAPFRQKLLRDPTMGAKFLDQHHAIYQAIRDHRPEDAASATRTHVNYATQSLAAAAGSEPPSRPGGTARDHAPRTDAGRQG